MMLINWYTRPTAIQLLMSNGPPYGQMDGLAGREMPDRQTAILARYPLDVLGDVQGTPRCMDKLTDIQMY